MEEIRKNDEKKDNKKDDKKDETNDQKTGLPLLHKFKLYENNDMMKVTTVRANCL